MVWKCTLYFHQKIKQIQVNEEEKIFIIKFTLIFIVMKSSPTAFYLSRVDPVRHPLWAWPCAPAGLDPTLCAIVFGPNPARRRGWTRPCAPVSWTCAKRVKYTLYTHNHHYLSTCVVDLSHADYQDPLQSIIRCQYRAVAVLASRVVLVTTAFIFIVECLITFPQTHSREL